MIKIPDDVLRSYEYQLVSEHYAERTTVRSAVPLINHINEGVKIMVKLKASYAAMKAFCLHPLIQEDMDLVEFVSEHSENHLRKATRGFQSLEPRALVFAIEYRNLANAYLPKNTRNINIDPIDTGVLLQVQNMLIADKVQNKKDFLLYNKTIINAPRLTEYFDQWLEALQVSPEMYEDLIKDL